MADAGEIKLKGPLGPDEGSAMTSSQEAPPTYTESSGQSPLPKYEDVERNAPPAYDSLFGKAKAMRAESSGNFDFMKKIIFFFVGTIGFTIFLGLILALPISMIVVGAVYLDDCPEEKYIPIWLVVAGSFGVLRNVIALVRRCISCCKKGNDEECGEGGEDNEDKKKLVNPVDSVIDCFVFAWFIAGNVWVYRSKGDISSDPNAVNYCEPTVYWFAFWIITVSYILMAAAIFCCCFCCICSICCLASKAKQRAENS